MIDLYDFVLDNVELNIEKGPYLTGSKLTHNIEMLFNTPNWRANDIDIVCRNISQVKNLQKLLSTISVPVAFKDNYYFKFKNNNSVVEIINFDGPGDLRVKWADFSICKIVSDNKQIICHKNTLEDVKNKILRIEHFKQIRSFDSLLFDLKKRYFKYKNRGYVFKPQL